jgi:predicted RNA-binding Zn-ribbon protein involved in translation (DUF1610 family)
MRYTRENLQAAVAASTSYAGVLRYFGKNQTGGNQTHVKSRIAVFGIDISHFTGQAHGRGKPSKWRREPSDILILRAPNAIREATYRLTRAMIQSGVPYKCSECGCAGGWNGKPLTLNVDHENGDWRDCRPENVRFLCPNCHSQTETFGSKNIARVAQSAEAAVSKAAGWGFDSLFGHQHAPIA